MFTDSAGFRRVASGVLLIVAPLLQLVAVLIDPGTWGDSREAVSYGDNPVLAQVQSVLYHWAFLLTALSVFGLLHVMRRRAVLFGHIVGALTILGYVNLSALLLTDPVEWWLGRHHPPKEAERILGEMLELPGVVFGFQMPWIFLAVFGLPVLLIGVWRAGFVHWAAPLVMGLAAVGSMMTEYGPATIPPLAAMAGVSAWLGVKMLRMSRAEWVSYYPSDLPGRTTPDSYANTTA